MEVSNKLQVVAGQAGNKVKGVVHATPGGRQVLEHGQKVVQPFQQLPAPHNAAANSIRGTYQDPKGTCRRCARIVCFLILLLLVYLIVCAFNIGFLAYEADMHYSQEGIKIELASCDIFVKSGSKNDISEDSSKHELKLEGLWTSVKDTRGWSSDGKKIEELTVENSKSCNQQPYMECQELCKVTVFIPPDNPPDLLWIYQSTGDTADHVGVYIEDVKLKDLWIRGPERSEYQRAGPSIEVQIRNSNITNDFDCWLKNGKIMASNTQFPANDVDIRSSNSISLLNVKNTEKVMMHWMQPMNQVCVSPSSGHLPLPDPHGKFRLCSSKSLMFKFQKYYDTSKDMYLDMGEFGKQLAKLPYCCGSDCPHASACSSLLRSLFPMKSDNATNDLNAGLTTVLTVWGKVQELGHPGLIPKCFRQLVLTDPVVQTRTAEGWPAAVLPPTTPAPVNLNYEVPCHLHSDCVTKFCGSNLTCAPNPQVTYSFNYKWSKCDKRCGTGQQLREALCIGSDGLQYPLSVCGVGAALDSEVRACNTRACVVPATAPTMTLSADTDLRPNYVNFNATVLYPAGSTEVLAYFGTGTAMLDPAIAKWTVNTSDPSRTCELNITAQLKSYVDRVYVVAASADGNSPAAKSPVIVDRVGKSTSAKWNLMSQGGLITVQMAGAPSIAWSPEDRLEGIRLNIDDAARLMKEVGPKLGDADSGDSGWIVIHVTAAPGLPETSWVYSPQAVNFAIDPAYLNLLTAGMLTPKMTQYRVSIQDNSCPFSDFSITSWDFSSKAHQERLGQIYKQLAKALLSDGFATGEGLRGQLMVLEPGTMQIEMARNSPTRWAFDLQGDGSVGMEEYEDGFVERSLQWAVLLSLLAGFFFSCLAAAAFHQLGQQALKENLAEKNRKKKLLERSLGSKMRRAKTTIAEAKRAEEDNSDKILDPFKNPLKVIEVIILFPLRRRLVNSLDRFLSERADIVPKEDRDKSSTEEESPVQPGTGLRLVADVELGQGATDPAGHPHIAPDGHGPPSQPKVAFAPGTIDQEGPAEPLGVYPEGKPDITRNSSVARNMSMGQALLQKGIPFEYMREFRKKYELYCILNDLEGISSRNKIVRGLVMPPRELRVTQYVVWRLRGVKWREDPLPLPGIPWAAMHGAADDPKSPSGAGPPEERDPRGGIGALPSGDGGGGGTPAATAGGTPAGTAGDTDGSDPFAWKAAWERDLVKAQMSKPPDTLTPLEPAWHAWNFCEAYLEVTGNEGRDSIDWIDRRVAGSTRMIDGFRRKYREFCRKSGIHFPKAPNFDPTNSDNLLSSWLDANDIVYQEVSKQYIKHLRWKTYKDEEFNYRSFLMDLCHVVCFVVIMNAPGCILMWYVTDSQVVFSRTLALKEPITWYDVYGAVLPPYLGYCVTDKESLIVLKLFAAWQITYMTMATLHCTFAYANVKGGWVRTICDQCFFVVFLLEVLFFLTWIGTIGSWCILAAILDPKSYLGLGSAVAVTGMTVITIWKELKATVNHVQEKVMASVSKRMQEVLKTLKVKVLERMHEQATDSLDLAQRVDKQARRRLKVRPPKQVDESKAGFREYHNNKEHAKEITIADVFMLLKEDDHDYLDAKDFKKLFSTLGDKIKASQVDTLFAICDTDGNQKIKEEELERGWEFIIQDVVKADMRELRATTTDIVIVITLSVALLLCLFLFIFFALRGWTQRTSFEAVIQGLMVSGCGKLVTTFRKRVPAEDGDIDSLLEEMSKGDGDAPGDDEDEEGDDGGDGD